MNENKKLKIAIFISSRGSNMEAILKNIKNGNLKNIEVSIVISDNENAKGLEIARSYGVKAEYINPYPYKTKLEGEAEDKVIDILQKNKVELICLAGYLRMIKSKILTKYKNRIINIHPALLPNFKGLHAQKQAIEANAKESGCTVHFIDLGMDTGSIIAQRKVKIENTDTEESLSKKILKEEHILYSEVLDKISKGKIEIG